MPVAESIRVETEETADTNTFNSILFSPPTSSLLLAGERHAIANGFTGPLVYKGVEYVVSAGDRVSITDDKITANKMPEGYVFQVGLKQYEWKNGRILLINGFEPMLGRVVIGIQGTIPGDAASIPLGQAILTTAPVGYYQCFKTPGGVVQREALAAGQTFVRQDGTTWRFTGTNYENISYPGQVPIAFVKNINLNNLTAEAIIDALDTIGGNPYPAVNTATGTIVLLALAANQTDQRENGPYRISLDTRGVQPTTVERALGFVAGNTVQLGVAFITVALGDRYGARFGPGASDQCGSQEWFVSSPAPAGATGRAPSVRVGVDRMTFVARRPVVELTKQIETLVTSVNNLSTQQPATSKTATENRERIETLEDNLKKVVTTEADPIALAEIEKLKTTIEALPAGGDTEGLTKLKEQVEALDTSKADQASVDELNEALKKLNDAIALGATDEELSQAKADLEKAIAAIKSQASSQNAEIVTLPILEAGVWAKFPTAFSPIIDFEIFDSQGTRLTESFDTKRSTEGWEIFSLARKENLIFEYEVSAIAPNKTVLGQLPANTWTDLPSPQGKIVDLKIFDGDFEISNNIELRRINGRYQVLSLVDKQNLSLEYETV